MWGFALLASLKKTKIKTIMQSPNKNRLVITTLIINPDGSLVGFDASSSQSLVTDAKKTNPEVTLSRVAVPVYHFNFSSKGMARIWKRLLSFKGKLEMAYPLIAPAPFN